MLILIVGSYFHQNKTFLSPFIIAQGKTTCFFSFKNGIFFIKWTLKISALLGFFIWKYLCIIAYQIVCWNKILHWKYLALSVLFIFCSSTQFFHFTLNLYPQCSWISKCGKLILNLWNSSAEFVKIDAKIWFFFVNLLTF